MGKLSTRGRLLSYSLLAFMTLTIAIYWPDLLREAHALDIKPIAVTMEPSYSSAGQMRPRLVVTNRSAWLPVHGIVGKACHDSTLTYFDGTVIKPAQNIELHASLTHTTSEHYPPEALYVELRSAPVTPLQEVIVQVVFRYQTIFGTGYVHESFIAIRSRPEEKLLFVDTSRDLLVVGDHCGL